jgi:hypothetical protein
VIGASPSGAAGIAKEVLALAETVSSLKSKSSPSSLFSLVTAEAVSADELNSLPTDPNAMLGLVKNSVASVSANNPIEGAAYGQFLVELATKVAEASKGRVPGLRRHACKRCREGRDRADQGGDWSRRGSGNVTKQVGRGGSTWWTTPPTPR